MVEQQELIFTASQQRLDLLMPCDELRFSRHLHGMKEVKDPDVQQTIFQEMAKEVDQATEEVLLCEAARPEITYPDSLPISQKKQGVPEAIRNHQVVIVAGEMGSDKTTRLPKICMELGRGIKGLISHTQLRRLVAGTVTNRIAKESKAEPGGCIGHKVCFSDRVSDNTTVKPTIGGILLAEIQQDRLLMQYDVIIIDEACERSLDTDLLLGYLKELLPWHPGLRITITFATTDPERFSCHSNDTPIIEVSSRIYSVGVRYRPIVEETDDTERDQLWMILDVTDKLSQESPDDILIFISGERKICNIADALNKLSLHHTEISLLYARLLNSEQNRVLQSHSGRCIVLATNAVETSLTVPGTKYVIDSGAVHINRHSYRTKVQCLPTESISQASTNQRKGRCGRMSKGIRIRLYSEDDSLSRLEFTDPGILCTNLTSVVLQIAVLGLGNIATLPFVEAPGKCNTQDGVYLPEELGVITVDEQTSTYKLTPLGCQLSQLLVDPRPARVVLEAQKHGCIREATVITSTPSTQDPRKRPMDKQQTSDKKYRHLRDKESNFLAFVNLWNCLGEQQKALSFNAFRRLCRTNYSNYLRVREWQDIYTQLRQVVKEPDIPVNSESAEYREIYIALLTGLLSRIGMKDADKQEYTDVRNARLSIFPGPGLLKKPPKWITVAELVETSRLWGRITVHIDPEWAGPVAQHLTRHTYSEPY